eukprot:Colp12_sorted_trinity150504_noHs@15699
MSQPHYQVTPQGPYYNQQPMAQPGGYQPAPTSPYPQQYTPPPGQQPYGAPPPAYGAPPSGPYPGQPAYGAPPPQGYYPQGMPQPALMPGQGQIVYMPPPSIAPPPNCPPGLEYLTAVNHIFVQQLIELLEAFTGFETCNKYQIKNALGQQVFFAAEDTDCCTRQCCGSMRPFEIKIHDNAMRHVMLLRRDFRFNSPYAPCLLPINTCFLQRMTVEAPVGQVLGYVEREWSLCEPWFALKLADGTTVLRIRGPCIMCECFNDINFEVFEGHSDHVIGRIAKKWAGLAQEMFTDADNFGVNFPLELDVRAKALLIAAVFLIDFMYFETSNQNQNHHHHHY